MGRYKKQFVLEQSLMPLVPWALPGRGDESTKPEEGFMHTKKKIWYKFSRKILTEP